MANYLYFLEVFVDTINFSYTDEKTIPKVKDVIVSTELGKFVKMDIFSMVEDNADNQEKNMNFNSGKSSLFPCTAASLLNQLQQNPLVLQVLCKNRPVGTTTIKWPEKFLQLVQKSPENFGVVGPVKMQDTFILKNKDTNTIAGDIKAMIKLSSFGENIQTNYQKIDSGDSKRKYLIRGARGVTTFECQKYKDGNSSDMLPVSSIYDELSYDEDVTNFQPFEQSLGISWMALFNSNLQPTESNALNMQLSSLFGPPGKALGSQEQSSTLTFDILSIVERPDENKYFDLRIKQSGKGITVEFDQSGDSVSEILTPNSNKALTVEEITRRLCKHKDCPAAQKFKEFGIGPLAKSSAIGTVYDPISPTSCYGLSQTYGTLSNYGPYGLYIRPKDPNQPFVPKSDEDWSAKCWKPKEKKDQERRECPPLRLTGGGVLDYDDIKSPFHECKEIMNQFDDILNKFKNAIGPCGKVTCPFAPNIMTETCKTTCQHPMDFKEEHPYQPPPELLNPPGSNLKLPFTPACQSNRCAYAKYKSGLTQEDDCMELQYMPPPTSGLCGHPKCPYPMEPELPPIHWDCPDPLPNGPCKNPNCPFLPKDLKCLSEVAQRKAPCGNSACPYSLPESCSNPDCPFADKECPYQQDYNQCDNPDCPYRNMSGGDGCCDMGNNDTCGNPECPYNIPNDDTCGNPDCPYTMHEQFNDCGNPDCPYNMQQQCFDNYQQGDDNCGNAQCPFNSMQDPCGMDPYSMQQQDPCGMQQSQCQPPPCPITIDLSCLQQIITCCMQQANIGTCNKPDCPLGANDVVQICFGGPTCPLNKPPCITEVKEEEEEEAVGDCGNPKCPFAKDPCCKDDDKERQKDDNVSKKDVDDDSPEKMPRGRYRASIALDKRLEAHEEAHTEYRSDTRTDVDFAPCNPQTCKSYKDGACRECHAAEVAKEEEELSQQQPAEIRRTYRPSLALDKKLDMHEIGPTEYRQDTRTDVDNAPCTAQTCKMYKDNLCAPCHGGARKIQSETGPSTSTSKKGKEKKTTSAPEIGAKSKTIKKTKGKFVYSIGDKYPGIQIGHKECVRPSFNVPKRMGWLWNIFTPCMSLKPRRGWRPGGVPKSIAEAIRKHREKQGLRLLELKKFGKRKGYGNYESETSVNVQPRPTLQIKKKDGCYWITMNPLKDPFSLAENEDPYMDCTPMQFKITKNKTNNAVKVRECDDGDYKTCYCGDDGDDDAADCVVSESSDSELDIEFTPPAGIIHPERFKRKKNVVHCDTQYLPSDFEPPKPPSEKGKKGKKGKKDKGKKGKGKGKKGKKK